MGHPLYALIEALGNDEQRDAEAFEHALGQAMEAGVVLDAAIASSERDRHNLVALRDELGEAFAPLAPLIVFDVSMALSDMPAFIDQADAGIRAHYPDAIILHYGHAGDGNLHVVVSAGPDPLAEERVNKAVFDAVRDVGGSISAEHRIGRLKRAELAARKPAAALAMMRAIKTALDPLNLMNPGKVVAPP